MLFPLVAGPEFVLGCQRVKVLLSADPSSSRLKMVAYWRQAGLSYIRYSAVCARVVRAALKPQFRGEAVKNAESSVRVNKVKTA